MVCKFDVFFPNSYTARINGITEFIGPFVILWTAAVFPPLGTLVSSGMQLDCSIIIWIAVGLPPMGTSCPPLGISVSSGMVSATTQFTAALLIKLPVL